MYEKEEVLWGTPGSLRGMDPGGTPARTGLHDEVCPFKTTLWN